MHRIAAISPPPPEFRQRLYSKGGTAMLKRLALLAAVLAYAAGTGNAAAQAKDKVTLMLNWYTYSEHAPFYLGKERGYFDQEGIDLDIQEGRGSGVTVQAVAAGTATFGYAD